MSTPVPVWNPYPQSQAPATGWRQVFPCGGAINAIDPDTLRWVMEALKDRVVELLKAAGVEVPDRIILGAGAIPTECKQLVISFAGLREGLINADAPPDPCYSPLIAEFQISLARCVTTMDARGNPPPPDAVKEDALRIMKDAYVLMKGACGLDMYGADVAHQNPGSQVALGGMGVDASIEVSDQLGGMQVVTLNIATVIG